MSFKGEVEDKAVVPLTPPKPCQELRDSINELRGALKSRNRGMIEEALEQVNKDWPRANRAQLLLSRDRERDDETSMKFLQMYADCLNDSNAVRAEATYLLQRGW